jgi:hypothetical protein
LNQFSYLEDGQMALVKRQTQRVERLGNDSWLVTFSTVTPNSLIEGESRITAYSVVTATHTEEDGGRVVTDTVEETTTPLADLLDSLEEEEDIEGESIIVGIFPNVPKEENWTEDDWAEVEELWSDTYGSGAQYTRRVPID